MSHSHCNHDHHKTASRSRLLWALVIAALYMVAEFVGGILSNSLALLADAGHMLADVAALGLSYFAVWIASRPAPTEKTYGYYRAEILAALANGASLIAISLFIFVEAYHRFFEPAQVAGKLMMGIASGGLIVNIIGLFILHEGKDHSLNQRGAWLHVMSDALGSVGAIIAGLLIWMYGWTWIDPVASILIGLMIIYSSWRLVKEAVSVLMESAPHGINVDEVRNAMVSHQAVLEVHDLHIWSITTGLDSLSAHVVIVEGESHRDLLAELRTMLHDSFGIDHITIQIEPEGFEERQTPI